MALSSVRHILSGGAPILPRLLQQLPQFAPQAEITILYGSTEAEPIAQIQLAQMQSIDLEAMQSGKACWSVSRFLQSNCGLCRPIAQFSPLHPTNLLPFACRRAQ
jgi:acyl-CoA synthetase (AMP-forming)/AMP-acid ligase II